MAYVSLADESPEAQEFLRTWLAKVRQQLKQSEAQPQNRAQANRLPSPSPSETSEETTTEVGVVEGPSGYVFPTYWLSYTPVISPTPSPAHQVSNRTKTFARESQDAGMDLSLEEQQYEQRPTPEQHSDDILMEQLMEQRYAPDVELDLRPRDQERALCKGSPKQAPPSYPSQTPISHHRERRLPEKHQRHTISTNTASFPYTQRRRQTRSHRQQLVSPITRSMRCRAMGQIRQPGGRGNKELGLWELDQNGRPRYIQPSGDKKCVDGVRPTQS